MASSLALKRLVSSNLVPTYLRFIRPSASASRLFNTDAVRRFDDDEDERGIEVDRRSGRNLSRRRDDFFSGAGPRRGWDVRETDDALNFRIDMPGLDKEDVKVSLEQNTLVIKGEGANESDEEDSGRRYTSRIDLPEKIYRTDQIKAEMKNGVLKVVVPKVKEEERADVFHVKVE
ncbi:hypothetical protein GH714_040340 [Hevea brasiliensis]|uniref:SHSP domain-containing protein n=1 Tax=Hevea brasiliensis TaxID=3981 RepID=A0A6A6MPV2_HEVBR|nr:hypothetical protein GH714_040340 [Hevea brasiliensis]